VGGKTGTAEKIDEMVDGQVCEYILSFVAFTPVDNPKIAILVLLDEPQVETLWGSVIAVPIVGRILDDLYKFMNIESMYSSDVGADLAAVSVPNLIGKDLLAAKDTLHDRGLKYHISGDKETVQDQLPVPGIYVPQKSIVTLYTEAITDLPLVEVPDVVSNSLSEAQRTLNAKGLNYMFKGSQEERFDEAGRVTSQSPQAGAMVKPGSVIELEFVYKSDAYVH
jgi:stage V sporulation protein D (sporulation-specific penicillin-binding protein)